MLIGVKTFARKHFKINFKMPGMKARCYETFSEQNICCLNILYILFTTDFMMNV